MTPFIDGRSIASTGARFNRVDAAAARRYIRVHMTETSTLRTSSKRGLAVAVVLTLALGACSVRQDITVAVDGSGTADVDIVLDEIFIRYLRDLSGSVGGESEDLRIFDVDEIRRRFAERPGIELTQIGRGGPGLLSLSLRFDDVAALLAEEGTSFLNVERSDGTSRLEILVSRAAVEEALSYSPLEGSAVSQMLLPPAGMGTEEYTDYLVWALEEYEEPEDLRPKIENAAIRLTVAVEGEIVSQYGGVRTGNTVRYDVSLVELLTLEEPRRYGVEFR